MSFYNYAPYVSVAKRRAKAEKKMAVLRKKGKHIQPIEIEGRKIARTFWGQAWCGHLENYSDYSNRLPRGRTYVRNGSVCHLEINKGQIKSIVSGSSLYDIEVSITPLSAAKWKSIKKQCAGQVGSLLELMQGKLSEKIMAIVTDSKSGLFPSPKEIRLNCNCPDGATMCKHVASVLYGIGARLDHQPELLFVLRGVDHSELISTDIQIPKGTSRRRQVAGDLSDVFGIELDDSVPEKKPSKKKLSTAKKLETTTIVKKKVKKEGKKMVKKVVKKKVEKELIETKPVVLKKTRIRPTGKSVTRLRKRFDMNLSDFAKLVGVSAKTISNWESQSEVLTLQPKNLEALAKVIKLDKDQAWGVLLKIRS